MTRRCIGLDVHRDFAQVAIWQDGLVRQAGQIAMTVEALGVFADSLAPTGEVALEATGNTNAIVRALRGRVARVVVANPQKTRAIAEAKVKTARSTPRSSRSCWPRTTCRRYGSPTSKPRHAGARWHGGRTSSGSALAQEPGAGGAASQPDPAVPGRGPVRNKGRAWLAEQRMPADERQAVVALLRQLDFHGQELALIDREPPRSRLAARTPSG